MLAIYNVDMRGRSSAALLAGSLEGAELPYDTCVQVDMHSIGRGGCACSAFGSW